MGNTHTLCIWLVEASLSEACDSCFIKAIAVFRMHVARDTLMEGQMSVMRKVATQVIRNETASYA